MSLVMRSRAFDAEEYEALSNYGADSTLWHLTFQRRADLVAGTQAYQAFSQRMVARLTAVDRAFTISRLKASIKLWSGHGDGMMVRGALEGAAAAFEGLIYRYPGFISTSHQEEWSGDFLSKRHKGDSRPTLLELDLPRNYPAIDMQDAGHFGEFEILLPRNRAFLIRDAAELDGGTIVFRLTPSDID